MTYDTVNMADCSNAFNRSMITAEKNKTRLTRNDINAITYRLITTYICYQTEKNMFFVLFCLFVCFCFRIVFCFVLFCFLFCFCFVLFCFGFLFVCLFVLFVCLFVCFLRI